MLPIRVAAFLTIVGGTAIAGLPIAPAAAQAPAPAAPQAPAPAATPPASTPPASITANKPADPVVAKVGSVEIRSSDLAEASQTLPEQYRSMPPGQLYPLLLDQLIDREALLALARKDGVDKEPGVIKAMARAQEQVLQNALLNRELGPTITEQALHARYDRDIAGKTGEEEVHARHILVPTEADAQKIIAELKKGADFATLAKARSADPGASQGGDLGFFKKGDMLPEFAAVAFSMKPGQITDRPVKTQYGWHVIKVEGRRAAPPPTFEQAHDELRQQMVQEGVKKVLADARAGVTVEKFNPDGSKPRATDTAEPPPAPKK